MYWQLIREPADPADALPAAWDGRFVLHRHTDDGGPHLDLRIEHGGVLLGWRIDGTSLDGAPWAIEKGPHPVHWLDQDGDAVREAAGQYAWLERDADGGLLLCAGPGGAFRIRVTRVEAPRPAEVRALAEALAEHGVAAADAPRLLADGLTARRRAVARLCGLGRELDGSAFDEAVWRRMLEGLPLDEIHGQLRAFEVRFDQAHPPRPVSRPEPLSGGDDPPRAESAWAILRG